MAPSPDPKSSPMPPVSGTKRRAVSLLPAFEPLSSSPALPRPLKRSRDAYEDVKDYPTPLPTSSTAVLSSSPGRTNPRPPLHRASSGVPERAPLSDVRTIDLTDDGKAVLMGRSSVSSHFQLSANRLISRVHVKACYKPSRSGLKSDRVEIECTGWNGAKVHCFGKAHYLHKDEIFISEDRYADIMVEVADARVMIHWPAKKSSGSDSEETVSVFDENSPSKNESPTRRRSFNTLSPLRQRQRIASPVSPSPAVPAALAPSSPFLPQPPSSPPPVEIYEDSESAEDVPSNVEATQSTQVLTQASKQANLLSQSLLASQQNVAKSLESSLTEPPDDLSDHDEENDPIIHSFGPFGANLTASMEAFNTQASPRPIQPASSTNVAAHLPTQTASPPEDSPQPALLDTTRIQSHIINQLAFSRLSSTPLSTIISHLPTDTPSTWTQTEIRNLIHSTRCIGEVMREGKDAAGKPLESEYYYIPNEDEDEGRKAAVVEGLGRTGLRSCRKQHKQYYWRRPKTP